MSAITRRNGFAALLLVLAAPLLGQDADGPQSEQEFLGPAFDINPSAFRPLR